MSSSIAFAPPAPLCVPHAARCARLAAAARLLPPPWRPAVSAQRARAAAPRSRSPPTLAAAQQEQQQQPHADADESSAAAGDPEELLEELRTLLLDPRRLLRAVATASPSRPRRPGARKRLELRPVRLKGTVRLAAESFVGTQSFSSNHAFDDPAGAGAPAAVEAALAERFDNWRVEARHVTLTLTRNRRGAWAVKRAAAVAIPPRAAASDGDDDGDSANAADPLAHDRVKARLLDAGDPLFVALGISTPEGRLKAAKTDKYIQARTGPWSRERLAWRLCCAACSAEARVDLAPLRLRLQVEEFLRLLDGAVADALTSGRLPAPTPARPLRLVDLGCGNAYLTFAAYALLSAKRGLDLEVVGVGASSLPQASGRACGCDGICCADTLFACVRVQT
jgi:hypothetical protein